MRRGKALALLLAGTILCCGGAVAADAGSAGDPLISLSWLKSTFIPDAVASADERMEQHLNDLTQDLGDTAGEELRVKRGDVLRLETGAAVIPLAGSLSVSASGPVVDLTEGATLPTVGAALVAGHRYLVAEKSSAAFSVTSDTAVLRLTGPFQLSPSAEIDYNALAGALKEMGLFRGTTTLYGSGYDLELVPTRIQGLVLFLRLMGEEQAALSYPGSVATFTDVPQWAQPYAAYAYDKGYTKGQGLDEQWRVIFGSEHPLTARDYTTFLLRALGCVEGQDFHWETALADAQALGVLTAGEGTLLAEKSFLRAQAVYLSYFALSAKTAGGEGTLLDRLTTSGAVDPVVAATVMSGLEAQRR